MENIVEETLLPTSIVKCCVVLLIGVALLAGFAAGSISGGGVMITFTQQPTDGDTVTLDGHVFEFDSGNGVAAGHIAVPIGLTTATTNANFKAAVSAYYQVV